MNGCNPENMGEDKLATVKLFRFEPETDNQPWWSEFKVPYQEHTVLDVMLYIYENLDSTFAFRWACDKGCCRGCVIAVNERPVLACMAPASKYMKIEPHRKFRVIKDLVVDFTEEVTEGD
ncbi:2Fe-2S iron-sulfur cluster-binding protein [Chloroflexota bacterium]